MKLGFDKLNLRNFKYDKSIKKLRFDIEKDINSKKALTKKSQKKRNFHSKNFKREEISHYKTLGNGNIQNTLLPTNTQQENIQKAKKVRIYFDEPYYNVHVLILNS